MLLDLELEAHLYAPRIARTFEYGCESSLFEAVLGGVQAGLIGQNQIPGQQASIIVTEGAEPAAQVFRPM